jgi:transposase
MQTKEERRLNISAEFLDLSFSFDERRTRLWCAAKARSYNREHGRGGVKIVHDATGVSRRRIYDGLKELTDQESLSVERVRRPGGGRKKITDIYPNILETLEALVDPDSRGDPESPLRWTCKSTYKLAEQLSSQGYAISHSQVAELLSELKYSLQSNKKTKEGSNHPDRDRQFGHINETVKDFQSRNQPVISVDTKKKENLGEYKNSGREYRPIKNPLEVNGHDFPDKELGKVVPYGIYDLNENKGWVSVGVNNDTSEFAVNAIRTWIQQVGKPRYPEMDSLLITADCGGSNGYRVRLWKRELQTLANEEKLSIRVAHYPPGTSKWNKIEHRMFSFISQNWRGKPLVSRQTVIELIGNTTTKTGLEIKVVLDEKLYQKGIQVPDEEIQNLNIHKNAFHGEWNYTIKPQKS